MTITRRSRPVQISDAPEHRQIPLDRVEMRESEENSNEFVLEGYASTFEEYDMYGGPERYGWIERIDKGAFDKTLREKPDLHLLLNHEGAPLARTKSGTCDLSVDDHGLKVVARLDKRDPEAMSLWVKMDRGDMDEMSFAFRVKDQEWSAAPGFENIDDETYRVIREVSLHKGDVSVVNFGANPTTSVALRMLAECDEDDLAELRSDKDTVRTVIQKLAGDARVTLSYDTPEGSRSVDIETEDLTALAEAAAEVDEAVLAEWVEAERAFTQSWLDAEAEFLAESDVADVEALNDDLASRWAVYKELLEAGVLTIAEVREKLGFAVWVEAVEVTEEADEREEESVEDAEERDEEEETADVEIDETETVEPRGMSLRLALALAD